MSNVIMAFVSIINGVPGRKPGAPVGSVRRVPVRRVPERRVPNRAVPNRAVPNRAVPNRAVLAGGAMVVAALIRRRYLRWGATLAEGRLTLPGDDLLPAADLIATRAITVHAGAADVWPWIAQLGQGRGGFYSYDFLENLVRCDIHSADRVHPEWQQIATGRKVRLAPEVSLAVAAIEPGTALVLRGGIPMGPIPTPYEFIWSFVILPALDGTSRLVVRERYRYTRRWAPLIVQPAELVSSLMSVRMLRGIKKRAEKTLVAQG